MIRKSPLAVAAALFGVAVLARVASWRDVFDAGRTYFAGNDAYYHARRILFSSVHFPDVLRFDPYINFPHGGEPIWSPLFDGATALMVRTLLGSDGGADMDWLIVWLPPLLGAATAVGVALLGRAALGPRAGWIAGFLLALFPAHVAYSKLGFVDHHVAVAGASVAILACGMAWLARVSDEDSAGGPGVALVAVTGAVLGAALLLWPGMLLELAALEVGLAVAVLRCRRASAFRRGALSLAGAHAFAFALVAPFSAGQSWLLWGSFSPAVLSSFQPWLLACGALGYAGLALSARGRAGSLSGSRRIASALVLATVALGASAVLVPDLLGAPGDAWRWLAKQEAFQAGVSESRPLFMTRGHIDLRQAETILSRAIFVLPLALLLSIRSALRAPLPAPRLFLLWWTALVFAATCVQVRFQSSLAPALALLLAWWIDRALAWSSTGERRLWKGVATGVLLLGVFQPWAGFYSRGLGNQLRWLRGEEPIVRPLDARRHLLVEVAEWIRENTPPTSGYLDAEAKPEYAVLSSWTDGHILGYVARRPTVTNNFGDDIGVENPVRADRYYVAEEDAASDILDDLRARYVLLEYRPTRPRRNFGPRSMLSRLYFSDGAAGERATVSREGELREIEHEASAVTRHRLVFESRPKPFLRGERPGFKLYEHVAGARLEGRAPAGARVEARLPIETNRGRRFEFVTHTRADDRGHYALAVPYASGASGTSGDAAARGGAVRSLDRYAVSAAGRSASVAVSEAAVREGLAVPGPDLRSLPSG